MQIGVIGAGSWGTTLANLLAKKGFNIALWVYEDDLIQPIATKRENSLYLPGVKLSEKIIPTGSLKEVCQHKDLLINVIPSQIVRQTMQDIHPYLPSTVKLVSATKGIENNTLLMKILYLYDFPLWGSGSGIYLRNMTKELVKLGYKIGIVAPEERRFMEDKIKQYRVHLDSNKIPVFVGHPELKGNKRYSELSTREITEVYKAFLDTTIDAISNFEPDIIHVQHLSLISWIARYTKVLKNIRYIITSHGSCLYDILSDKRYLHLSEDAIRHAKAITVVSGDSRSKLLKTFGRQYSKNLEIIPGGIDMDNFPTEIDTSAVDKTYKLKNKKVALFTGRLISHKGVKYLVGAAKDIEGEILIVGEGPEKAYLESLIAQKGLKNVHLIGYLKGQELINLYYRADVFVAPSVWDEPLGLTIVEAMASKTPVIATRKGGIPLLVKHGHNGLFVKPRNSKKIAEAVNKLLKDAKLREKMGEEARKTVEKDFTWKIIAKKFDRLYKKYGNGHNKNGNSKNGKNGHNKSVGNKNTKRKPINSKITKIKKIKTSAKKLKNIKKK